jgi:hypothetical protein
VEMTGWLCSSSFLQKAFIGVAVLYAPVTDKWGRHNAEKDVPPSTCLAMEQVTPDCVIMHYFLRLLIWTLPDADAHRFGFISINNWNYASLRSVTSVHGRTGAEKRIFWSDIKVFFFYLLSKLLFIYHCILCVLEYLLSGVWCVHIYSYFVWLCCVCGCHCLWVILVST